MKEIIINHKIIINISFNLKAFHAILLIYKINFLFLLK